MPSLHAGASWHTPVLGQVYRTGKDLSTPPY